MNEDCYFEIGHSHTICEDYALAGKINENLSYAIVCDGCSSSDTVDLGARLLAHSAKEYLTTYYKKCEFIPDSIDPFEVGLSIVQRAAPHAKVLMLPNTILDATLIITLADVKGMTRTFFYGDGGMLHKLDDDSMYYSEVEFPSGAPFYLSYLLEPAREKLYATELGRTAIIKNYEVKEDGLIEIEEKVLENMETPEFFRSIAGEYTPATWTSIMSDGMKTYQVKNETGIPIDRPFVDAIKQASSYKGFKGKFVERRMKRMRQNCEKDSVTHYDDISVATIYMGE